MVMIETKLGKFWLHKMKGRELFFFKRKPSATDNQIPDGLKLGETSSGLPFLKGA